MQALIDFDGWRKWKDFSSTQPDSAADRKSALDKKKKKNRTSLGSVAGASSSRLNFGNVREEEIGSAIAA